jgi:hypothetical protein
MTKRYQRGNQIERQTIQWPKDTKEVIRNHKWNCIVCRSIWLPLWYLLVIVLSVVPSDYLFGIFWSLYCLSFHLITSLVSFGHCIVCCSIYGFWLPLMNSTKNWRWTQVLTLSVCFHRGRCHTGHWPFGRWLKLWDNRSQHASLSNLRLSNQHLCLNYQINK